MKKQSRRRFIQLLYTSIFAAIILLWNFFTLKHLNKKEAKERILPLNRNKEVAFFNKYIVLNRNGNITVLSSHCTHLGCKIKELKNGRLICPCHGSEYDLNGIPVKGPAFKPLQIIPAIVSPDKSSIEIIT